MCGLLALVVALLIAFLFGDVFGLVTRYRELRLRWKRQWRGRLPGWPRH